jgi:Helicase HerA, central domain
MGKFPRLCLLSTAPKMGAMDRRRITHFARTNARNQHRVFGIKQPDRLSHMYIIGKTGTGKSTLLERLILSDVEAGEGLALVDPHGDLVHRRVQKIQPWLLQPDAVTRKAFDRRLGCRQ